MDAIHHQQPTPARPSESRQPPMRLPRARLSAALAAATLGIGAAVGAALGPGPESSLAGDGASALAQRLPLLIAAIDARAHSSATTPTSSEPPVVAPEATPAAAAPARQATKPASGTGSSASKGTGTGSESESAPSSSGGSGGGSTRKKLPAVTSVWLIELSGPSFAAALAQPSAAPYIDGQAVPAGALLSTWSALSGSALANDAALAEPPAPGAPPPLLHSIVQPPCPEGAAGASCAPETPGQLSAADTFLKETLATITATPAYKEHGLVVITFATVAVPTQAGLPAASSSATLTSQPPAGVLLMSPFVRAGSRPTTALNPTSPRQSLEALLH
jgi:hypothetical protein